LDSNYLYESCICHVDFNNSFNVPIVDECEFDHLDGEVGCGRLELR